MTDCREYINNLEEIEDEVAAEDETNDLEKPSPPILLLFCPLNNAVETLMHLTMNCSKHIITQQFAWAQRVKDLSQAEMIKEAGQYFKAVKNLQVSSFPAIPFKTDKLGGYVAENYRTYMQIAPWAYRFIEKASLLTCDLEELKRRKKADTKWKKNECHAFLYARNIETKSKMTLKELILMVNRSFKKPTERELVQVDAHFMRKTILILNNYISAVFCKDLTGSEGKNRATALARLYLANTVMIDKHVLNTNHSWLTTYSLLGMLRLPDMYDLTPFPLCFYEGDKMGEGIVKDIRPLVWAGLRDGWSKSTLISYYQNFSLSYITELIMGKDEMSVLHNQQVTSRSFSSTVRFYKTYHEVNELMAIGDGVFSFALFQDKNNVENIVIGIICKDKNNGKTMRKIEAEAEGEERNESGFLYFKSKVSNDNSLLITNEEHLYFGNFHFSISGIALPFPGDRPYLYAFILSDGRKKVNGPSHKFNVL